MTLVQSERRNMRTEEIDSVAEEEVEKEGRAVGDHPID